MTLRFSLFLWLWRKEARCCRPHSCISIQPCLLFLSSALHVYTALLVSLFSCCLVEWAFCLEVWGCLCEETGFFARLIDDIWACLWPRIVFIVHCPSFCSIVCTDTCQYLVSTDWTVMHYHLAFPFCLYFISYFVLLRAASLVAFVQDHTYIPCPLDMYYYRVLTDGTKSFSSSVFCGFPALECQ